MAQQIEAEAHKFAMPLGYKCVSIVGGHSMYTSFYKFSNEQHSQMRNGAEIVIATPGRLKDCIDQRMLVLNQCTYLVMDEAGI